MNFVISTDSWIDVLDQHLKTILTFIGFSCLFTFGYCDPLYRRIFAGQLLQLLVSNSDIKDPANKTVTNINIH